MFNGRTRGPARVPRTPPGQPPCSMAGFDVVPGVGRLLFSGKYHALRPVDGARARNDAGAVDHPRLGLRNVVANYPFESSRGFPQSEPNSGYADHSRLSCSAGGYAASGLGSAGIFSKRSARTWPSFGVAEKARIGRDLFFRSEDHRLAAKPRICSDAPDTALPPLALAFGLGMGEPANGALACC